MRGPVHPRRPPPWWPANEPWPPATRGPWLYRRNRFMRRAGCLVAAVLFLSAIGAATLLSFALGRAGIVSGLAQLSVLVVVAAIGLLLFSMMFLRVMSKRRIAWRAQTSRCASPSADRRRCDPSLTPSTR